MKKDKITLKLIKKFEKQVKDYGEVNAFGDIQLSTDSMFNLYKKQGDINILMLNTVVIPGCSEPLFTFIYTDKKIIKILDKNEITKEMAQFYGDFK